MGKVVATFHDAHAAEKAIDELKKHGFNEKEISLASKDTRKQNEEHQGQGHQMNAGGQEMNRHDLSTGATVGAGVGAGAALLATAGALAIPGIGPILALGPLAATLTGAAAGGLVGAFMDWGIPKQEGEHLQKEVQEGRAVVLVDSHNSHKAEEILRQLHAQEVRTFQ